MPDTTIIRVNRMILPTSSPLDSSEGEFCIRIGAQWGAYWIGLLSVMRVRSFWLDTSDEEWAQIQEWIAEIPPLLLDCVDCPTPPPTTPPTPPPQLPSVGASEAGSGTLGLSIEELEELVEMAITKIEYRGKELWYRDGCCDWYKVTTEDGETFPLESPTQKAAGQTLQSWAASGKPNLSTGQLPVPSDNEFYTTDSSQACAKATAIVEFFQTLLDTVRNGVGTSALSITGLFQALATAAAALGLEDSAVIMEFATFVVGSLTGSSALDFSNDVDDALADPNWNDVICTSVPQMSPIVTVGFIRGNLCTEEDVNAVYQNAVELITMSDDVRQVLQTFPLVSIQNKVRENLPAQDCNCEQYLPFGYEPNPLTGLNFTHEKFASMGTTLELTYSLDNQVLGYEDTLAVPHIGQKVGSFGKTVYAGSSGGKQVTRFHWIVKLSRAVTLGEVKLTFSRSAADASIYQVLGNVFVYSETDSKWHTFGAPLSDSSSPFALTYDLAPGNQTGARYIAIEYVVQGILTGTPVVYGEVTDFKISGVDGGVGFTDLPIDTSA